MLLFAWSTSFFTVFSLTNGFVSEHANIFRNWTTSNISAWELHIIGDQVFEITALKCNLTLDSTLKYLKAYIRDRASLAKARYKLNDDFAKTQNQLAECLIRISQSKSKNKSENVKIFNKTLSLNHRLHDSHYHPHVEESPEVPIMASKLDTKSIWNEMQSLKKLFVRSQKQLSAKSRNLTLSSASALEAAEYEFKHLFKQSLGLVTNFCLPNKFGDSQAKYLLDVMDSILNTILADSEVHLIHYADQYLQRTKFVAQINKCIS